MVEWCDEQSLSAEFAYSIRSEISFRVLREISVQSDGRSDKEAIARDNQRDMSWAGDRYRERADHGRSGACVFIGATEIFSGRGNETNQRKKFGESFSRISGGEETILGTAFLGTRIFREHSWGGRRDNQKIHQGSDINNGRQATQALGLNKSHRLSRWSFTDGMGFVAIVSEAECCCEAQT